MSFAKPQDPATDGITRKAAKLGATVVGSATSAVQTVPGSIAQYQTYTNGVIVFSDDYGAVFLTQAIFNKWLSLKGQTNGDGKDLFNLVGLPVQDYSPNSTFSVGFFEQGQIYATSSGSHVVYGPIYVRYDTSRLITVVGIPTSDEGFEPGRIGQPNGQSQWFEYGKMFYRSDIGAFVDWGTVLDRRERLSDLGFPTTDTEQILVPGAGQIGLTGRFEHGVVYASDSSGAWDMDGPSWRSTRRIRGAKGMARISDWN